MNFQVLGSGAAQPLEKTQPGSGPKTPPNSKKAVSKSEPVTLPQDQLKAQKWPAGQGLRQVSLVENQEPALSARLQRIQVLIGESAKAHLSLPQKEEVLSILKDSQKEGSLPALTQKLHEEQQLLPLYQKMGSLINRSPESSALLGLMTLGLSLGEETKSNRAFEMKKILTDAGISPALLKELKN